MWFYEVGRAHQSADHVVLRRACLSCWTYFSPWGYRAGGWTEGSFVMSARAAVVPAVTRRTKREESGRLRKRRKLYKAALCLSKILVILLQFTHLHPSIHSSLIPFQPIHPLTQHHLHIHTTANMQLTQTIVAALFAASSVVAAPAPTEKSMMVQGIPEWTIEGVHRWCNWENTQCNWKFTINPKIYSPTPVNFVVKNAGATPAAQNNGAAQNFGDYTITSGWSGQFGPGNGFTTFAVVDNKNRRIAYPAYRDAQVENGQVVSPDLSFQPQALP
ncbi:hypothetical protein J3458_014451 [Metarhizium acridum]|nr:hypothetical protein J3458_014451 [Metarhizium acridum]